MTDFIDEHNIPCPTCGKHNFTDIRQFNLMFKTFQGVTEDAKNTVYLKTGDGAGYLCKLQERTANFQKESCRLVSDRSESPSVMRSHRATLPSVHSEFEQMELEFFCEPGTDLEWFQYWRSFCINWLKSLGMKEDELRLRDHDPEELCFYSKGTTDIEFLFPFGWGELWGIADRTDYDLTQHQNVSGQDMSYFDDETEGKIYSVRY